MHDHCNNEEVMKGFLDTVEKIGILLEVRKMEDTFMIQRQQRKEFLVADPKAHKEWTHYPKYPSRDSPGVHRARLLPEGQCTAAGLPQRAGHLCAFLVDVNG